MLMGGRLAPIPAPCPAGTPESPANLNHSYRYGDGFVNAPIPLGVHRLYWSFVGAWLSLVERSVRDREVAGSNPVAPTNKFRSIPET